MSEKTQSKLSFTRNPLLIAVFLIIVVVVIVVVDQRDELPQKPPVVSQSTQPSTQATQADGPSGMPQIVDNINAQSPGTSSDAAGNVVAPGLDSLLTGLEQKVAADPKNDSNRILLAQTYNELGMQDKAISSIREVTERNPENGRATLVLASILSQSSDNAQLQESIKLLDSLGNDTTIQQYLVSLYKGDALIRTQDHAGALTEYKRALETMPPSDNRRTMLERRVENLSSATKGEQQSDGNAQVKG